MTDFRDIHWHQAVAAFDRGHLNESIEHLRKAIEWQPDNPDLHLDLAIALDGAGDIQGAGAEYHEAVCLSPADEGLHYALGTHFLKAQQWDQAIASFQQALHLHPGYLDAFHGMTSALQRKAQATCQSCDYHAYLEAVEQMISLAPEKLVWRRNRAWALWETGRRLEALTEMEELLSLDPTSRNYSRVLNYQRRLGRWHDFLRTSRAMWRFEYQRAWRRQKWQASGAGETKPK